MVNGANHLISAIYIVSHAKDINIFSRLIILTCVSNDRITNDLQNL